MPQAVLLAAIPAAAALGGAVIQSRASSKATKASQQANTEALNFTKSQAELAAADYQRRYDTWLAERQALLSRYGISIPPPAPPSARPGAVPSAAVPPGAPEGGGFMGGVADRLRPLAARQRPGVALVRGATVADMLGMRGREAPAEWNDWSGYGLRPA